MNFDQTYTLRQKYLNEISYSSNFPHINAKMGFDEIGEHIGKALSTVTPENLPANNINDLYLALDSIVYLGCLADRYVQQSGFFCKHLRNAPNKQGLLTNLLDLMKQKQSFFHDELQKLIQNTSNQDPKIENLINMEINYLNTSSQSDASTNLGIIITHKNKKDEFNEIKTDAANLSKKLEKLLEAYKLRCREGVEMTDMSKTKNNADDDSGSLDSFHTAVEDQDEQTIDIEAQRQPTTKKHNKPTIHVEEKEQNPSYKNNLLTKIWALIQKIWQHIKNIFQNPEKNHELDTVISYSATEQRITELRYSTNVREIPAAKTGYQTLFSTTADSQQNQPPENVVVGYIKR